MDKQEYINFMCNPDNIMNCENCPENEGYDSGGFGNIHPCGQFNCWVVMHCCREDGADHE